MQRRKQLRELLQEHHNRIVIFTPHRYVDAISNNCAASRGQRLGGERANIGIEPWRR